MRAGAVAHHVATAPYFCEGVDFLSRLIIVGHGGYGTAMKNTLAMLVGETPGIVYVDFNLEDDLNTLIAKLQDALASCGDDEVLFACDVAGGSPFRQCAVLCLRAPGRYFAIAGLNVATYAEMAYNLELSAAELLELAEETARMTVARFPEKQQDG